MDIHKMIHTGDAGISQLLDNKMHVKVEYEKTSRHEERYTLKNGHLIANGNADHDVMIEVIKEMMKMLIKLSILIKAKKSYHIVRFLICLHCFFITLIPQYTLNDTGNCPADRETHIDNI